MRLDKLTVKAQEAIAAAQAQARRRDHQALEAEHLLVAMLEPEDGVARAVLARIGADPGQVLSRAEDELRTLPKVEGGEPYPSQKLLKLVDRAEDEAKKA